MLGPIPQKIAWPVNDTMSTGRTPYLSIMRPCTGPPTATPTVHSAITRPAAPKPRSRPNTTPRFITTGIATTAIFEKNPRSMSRPIPGWVTTLR